MTYDYGELRTAVEDATRAHERIDVVVFLLCMMPEHLREPGMRLVRERLGGIESGRVMLSDWVEWLVAGHGALWRRVWEHARGAAKAYDRSGFMAAEFLGMLAHLMAKTGGQQFSAGSLFAGWATTVIRTTRSLYSWEEFEVHVCPHGSRRMASNKQVLLWGEWRPWQLPTPLVEAFGRGLQDSTPDPPPATMTA